MTIAEEKQVNAEYRTGRRCSPCGSRKMPINGHCIDCLRLWHWKKDGNWHYYTEQE